jgi:hypothetical protein
MANSGEVRRGIQAFSALKTRNNLSLLVRPAAKPPIPRPVPAPASAAPILLRSAVASIADRRDAVDRHR